MLAAAEAGKIYMLPGAWNEPFLREFDSFPGGAFDDQVDTVGAGYQKLSGKKIFTASWGRNTGRSAQANSNTIKKAQFQSARSFRVTGATFGRKRA
jgi:hypothetical protein